MFASDQSPSLHVVQVNYITVAAKGEIYPCHHFYYNDPEKTTKIGVWNGIDEQTEDFC